MPTDSNQTKARQLIRRALDTSVDKERYLRRLEAYPTLKELGLLPLNVDEIVDAQQKELFHALAFRMATYSECSEDFFSRFEFLLDGAKNANGWEDEYAQWSKKDHWAKNWDKSNQFLWQLQCFEYFSNIGYDISFPISGSKPKPDFCVKNADGSELYVECFFFTKWWGREHLIEDLLRALDPHLSIERKHNLAFAPSDNPLSGDDNSRFIAALVTLAEALAPENLTKLRATADEATPQLVCNFGVFSVLLEGSGYNIPDRDNAHGDPRKSWQVYVDEIKDKKKDENGLGSHRPNLVMVNGLGLDFQLSGIEETYSQELTGTLDEIRIHACGINDKIGQHNLRAVLKNPSA